LTRSACRKTCGKPLFQNGARQNIRRPVNTASGRSGSCRGGRVLLAQRRLRNCCSAVTAGCRPGRGSRRTPDNSARGGSGFSDSRIADSERSAPRSPQSLSAEPCRRPVEPLAKPITARLGHFDFRVLPRGDRRRNVEPSRPPAVPTDRHRT